MHADGKNGMTSRRANGRREKTQRETITKSTDRRGACQGSDSEKLLVGMGLLQAGGQAGGQEKQAEKQEAGKRVDRKAGSRQKDKRQGRKAGRNKSE